MVLDVKFTQKIDTLDTKVDALDVKVNQLSTDLSRIATHLGVNGTPRPPPRPQRRLRRKPR
ncbi:MAG TPA: hypothetical protein VNO30_07530 [Kofleriaceae bacterium]|nr:hypothetical protein [Kofleriaceae bacterium]